MPNLYLIDGAAGSGKSDFLRYCSDENKIDCYLVKYTTKEKDADGVGRKDLVYLTDAEYNAIKEETDYEYRYPSTSTTKYLIKRKQLDELLKVHNDVFVIVRSSQVIKKIKEDYKRYININILSIFIYCDNEKLSTRTREQIIKKNTELSEDAIKEKIRIRLDRNKECIDSYINSLSKNDIIYDYVILNDVSHEQYYQCIDNIRAAHKNFDDKFKQPTAFVIMPMPNNRESAHFFKVKEAIYRGAKEVGYVALRQDDNKYTQETILANIKKSIEDATICIADLTNSRPNCYFETGLAYAKNSKNSSIPNVVLLIEEGEQKVEFDLSGVTHSKYYYAPNDYSHITRLVTRVLKDITKEHIFITKYLDEILNIND